jgi:hypothetical protein
VLALVAVTVVTGTLPAQDKEPEWRRILNASESEQTVWINSHLRAGMPANDGFLMVMLNRSSVVLPLMAAKIEEVLTSPAPLVCLDDKSVDPQQFVDRAAFAVAGVGDVQALKELSKLIRIDEKRFGDLIEGALLHARTYRNPFSVAYQGLDLDDPAVSSRIAAWAEVQLAESCPSHRPGRPAEPVPDFERAKVRTMWAEAIADRYKSVPTEIEWAKDPLASRLESIRARVLRDEVLPAVAEALRKRPRK